MTDTSLPILYSFRRCPYAMRARMAVRKAGVRCELREVVLRDKPSEMIEASPKATVPVLVLAGGKVVDESYDVMLWALRQGDPENWLAPAEGTQDDMFALIDACEQDFKPHLDRYKYGNRYADANPHEHRELAEVFLKVLEARLEQNAFLFGDRQCMGDIAIAPFIRQFANTGRDWFDTAPYPKVQTWLASFIASETFSAVMTKYSKWQAGDEPVLFP